MTRTRSSSTSSKAVAKAATPTKKKKKIHLWKGVDITTLNYQEIYNDLEKLSQHKMLALCTFFELATKKCKDVSILKRNDVLRENLGQFLMFMLRTPECDGMKCLEIEELDEHPVEDLPCKYIFYALIC